MPLPAHDDMRSCVPPNTVALAGVHLDRVRGTNAYRSLPAGWKAALAPLEDSGDLLLAYDGRDLLVIARGHFAAAPAGATLLSPELALAGSPEAVRAAARQRATGKPGAPALVARAAAVENRAIWAVVRGAVPLPLPGNFENLNRLLRSSEYTTFAVDANSGIEVEAAASCASAEAARRLEETLRAMMTLSAGTVRDRDLAALIHSARLRRDDSTVHVALSATAASLEKLLP